MRRSGRFWFACAASFAWVACDVVRYVIDCGAGIQVIATWDLLPP